MLRKLKTPLILLSVLFLGAVIFYSGPNNTKLSNTFKTWFTEEESSQTVTEESILSKVESNSSNIESISPTEDSKDDTDTVTKTIAAHYTVASAQEDLYISILDSEGQYISESFTFTIKAPNGQKTTYESAKSGVWYKTNLSAGSYTITIQDLSVISDHTEYLYTFATKIQTIQVNEKVKVEVIDFDKLRSTIATDVDEEELKGTDSDKGEAEEVVITTFNADIYEGYVHTYTTGPNGYLWQAGSNKTIETDVKPVLNDDGELEYGLRDDGDIVQLFYPDGEPFPEYDIEFLPPEGAKLGEYVEDGKRYYYKADGTVVEGPGLKKINNKLYFITQDDVISASCGIDISAYQTVTDWSKVKASGIDFVIIRIGGRGWGTGALFQDSKGVTWLQQARDAGLKVGVYFFSAAINTQEAVEEASLCLDLLNGFELDYPVFFDTEFCNTSHTGRSDSLSKEQRTLIAKTFCETIESQGYKAGIYASASFYCSQLEQSELSQYMFWMAHYTKNYALSAYPVDYKIWQFTSSGSIDGITGRVDMNTIFD